MRQIRLFWKSFVFVSLWVLVLGIGITVTAQGIITYGSGVAGSISAEAPINFYSFSGAGGDLVTIRALAITPNLTPSLSVNGPDQQQLALSQADPFSAGEASIRLRLPQTGVYTVIVSGQGTIGDYALRLDGQAAPPSTAVDGIAQSPVQGASPQIFTVTADPVETLILTVRTTTAGFAFAASISADSGAVIGTLNGSDTQPISLNLQPGTATYEIAVLPVNPANSGAVEVSAVPLGAASVPVQPPPPATTEEPVTEICAVTTSGNNVNVRTGPGINFGRLTGIDASASYPVLGINGDWYLIDLGNGLQGWVAIAVIVTIGDCSAVPPITGADPAQPSETLAPTGVATATATSSSPASTNTATVTAAVTAPPQTTPTATPSYTATTTAPAQATATYTPSYTPTTQPAAQIAPEDPRFNNPLVIPLDNTASVLDFVSYPDGDREDRVRFEVSGMNNNSALSGGRARLVISVSCFGQNTDQVQFFTGGQTYSCGQTIVDREVTADSDTGSVVITAVGGEGTYVQWVLTGTATRTN